MGDPDRLYVLLNSARMPTFASNCRRHICDLIRVLPGLHEDELWPGDAFNWHTWLFHLLSCTVGLYHTGYDTAVCCPGQAGFKLNVEQHFRGWCGSSEHGRVIHSALGTEFSRDVGGWLWPHMYPEKSVWTGKGNQALRCDELHLA